MRGSGLTVLLAVIGCVPANPGGPATRPGRTSIPPPQTVSGGALVQPAAAAPAQAQAAARPALASSSPIPVEPVAGVATPEAARPVEGGPIRALWEAGRAAAEERARVLRERVATEPAFRSAMTESLAARGHEFLFTTPATTSAGLDLLLQTLRDLSSHGLSASNYPVEALQAAVDRFRGAAGQASTARALLEADDLWRAVRGIVERRDPPTEAEVAGLVSAGRIPDPDDEDEWAGVAGRYRDALEAERMLHRARADVEVPAMAAFFRYVLDMKLLVIAHPFKADKDPATADERFRDRLVASFEEFARAPGATLEGLAPKHPYYAALRKGLAHYREMAARGPFPVVSFKGKLKRGARGPAVRAVRERLSAEGYLADAGGDIFDKALEDAVKAYQATHGFDVTGILEERHVKSLNVPVEQRVRQLELGLQRWRESEVRHEEPIYVRVNIPEFMMEVWEAGRLVQKHRVVTGNNNWDKDVDNRVEGRINRTKIFTAAIQHVLLNPKWHVPGRIRREELEFDILKEPDYYARHNFKVKTLPDGREEIYQDSGHNNALGRVKFTFPNPYGIFMHDTNLKEFFKREIRAFSHGCIRLQDPLEVAFFLLEKGKGMSREEVEAILGRREEKQIDLDTKIPIFIEYNSVGVDEQGRPMFFSDVYGYDRDFFEGKIPYSEEELKLLLRKIPKAG